MTGMGEFDDKRDARRARRAERRENRPLNRLTRRETRLGKRWADAYENSRAKGAGGVAGPNGQIGPIVADGSNEANVPVGDSNPVQSVQEVAQAAAQDTRQAVDRQMGQIGQTGQIVTDAPSVQDPAQTAQGGGAMDVVRQVAAPAVKQYVINNGLARPVSPAQAIAGTAGGKGGADRIGEAVAAQVAAQQVASGTGSPAAQAAGMQQAVAGDDTFADFVAGLPEEYDLAIQAAQQYAANPAQVQPSDLGSFVEYLKQYDDRLTDEERKKLKRRERAGRIITAVGDGLAAIADIAGTARHAPFVERTFNSPLYGQMWDDFNKRVEDKDNAWLNLYLNAYGRDTEAARQAAIANARLRGDANSDLVDALKNKGDAARDWMKLLFTLEGDKATRDETARHNRATEENQRLSAQGKSKGSGGGSGDEPPFKPFTRWLSYGGNRYRFDIDSYEDAITYVSYLKDAGVIAYNPFEQLYTPQGFGIYGNTGVDTDTLKRYGDMALTIINSVEGKEVNKDIRVSEDVFRNRYNNSRFGRTGSAGGGSTSSAREKLVEMIGKAIAGE